MQTKPQLRPHENLRLTTSLPPFSDISSKKTIFVCCMHLLYRMLDILLAGLNVRCRLIVLADVVA
eukprot:6203523-Pleurochrysis_carterae.AAC.1